MAAKPEDQWLVLDVPHAKDLDEILYAVEWQGRDFFDLFSKRSFTIPWLNV
jgi:hypothetical protein